MQNRRLINQLRLAVLRMHLDRTGVNGGPMNDFWNAISTNESKSWSSFFCSGLL